MKRKILIVDDERPNIRLLERLFSDSYECFSAASVDEALVMLDQHDVAVIITDQRMPKMTGIDLLKRSADQRPHMVRILLTGYTDLEALIEAVNCGLVYMYVQKPWNNEDLKLRMARAIDIMSRIDGTIRWRRQTNDCKRVLKKQGPASLSHFGIY